MTAVILFYSFTLVGKAENRSEKLHLLCCIYQDTLPPLLTICHNQMDNFEGQVAAFAQTSI
jgi:hypothetical protein